MQRIWVQPGCPEHYLGRHGEIPVKRNGLSIGFASLPVCVYLVGQPWDDFALSCIERYIAGYLPIIANYPHGDNSRLPRI